MYVIPHAPGSLKLPVTTYWDGTSCGNVLLHGLVEVQAYPEGLRITASLPTQAQPSTPEQEPMTRVHNLWEYDVVECFIVGEKKYLEVELGAGGHFLVLDFLEPRVRDNEYEGLEPQMSFEPKIPGSDAWRSSLLLPWDMIPEGIRAINAFVISRENFLCHSPLPGPHADFHQPSRFPEVKLAQ